MTNSERLHHNHRLSETGHKATNSSKAYGLDNDEEERVGLLSGGDSNEAFAHAPKSKPSNETNRKRPPSRMTHTIIVAVFIIVLTLIMIWDMNKVYNISEMIHDDHNDLWEPMNETALRSWWSPLDICLLKMNDSSLDVKSYRAKTCSKLPGINLTPSNDVMVPKLFCNAGSSLGKSCPAPLNDRNYFYYRLRDVRYRDGRATFLSDALKSLAKKRMPLVFVGDGLSKQNEDAVVCDLLRTDGNLITVMTGLAYLQQKMGSTFNRSALTNTMIPDYVVRWRNMESFPLEIKYFKLWAVEDEAEAGNDASASRKARKTKKRSLKRRYLHHDHSHSTTGNEQNPREDHSNWLADSPVSRSSVASRRVLVGGVSNDRQPNSNQKMQRNSVARSVSESNPDKAKVPSKQSSLPSTSATRTSIYSTVNNSTAGKPSIIPSTVKSMSANRTSGGNFKRPTNFSSGAIPNYGAQATPTVRLSFQQVQDAVHAYILQQKRSVALVANLGVFYNSREKFREELPFFLSWLHHLQDGSPDNLIFYRETAAQHWNHTEMGYYDVSYREETANNGSCVPIADNRLGEIRSTLYATHPFS
jgi:hypothetical protein